MNAALANETAALNKLPPKSRIRAQGMMHVHEVRKAVGDVVASVGKKGTQSTKKAPIDHRDRERVHALPHKKVLQAPEAHIAKGQKQFFIERYTMSVNQQDVSVLGKRERVRKVRSTTADIHWTQFRRFLGLMTLTADNQPPVSIPDVLTETNITETCRFFEERRNMDGNFYSVSTIEMFERMFVAMGKAVFEGVHRDDWVDMVHHRIGDAIKSRKERGDVDRESDGANQIVHKRKATYQDVVHNRQKFAAATDKMAKTQTSPDWPPAHFPENVVESQRILLARRKAALLGHYLLTHITPLRDEAGSSLIWNRHLKVLENKKGEKVFQYRRIELAQQRQPRFPARSR